MPFEETSRTEVQAARVVNGQALIFDAKQDFRLQMGRRNTDKKCFSEIKF